MNCWKTINLNREFGLSRICLLSLLLGMLSFIFLYLFFSMIHQTSSVKDHGLIPLIAGLILLPTIHKLTHILPLILANKRIKFKWQLNAGIFPNFTFHTKTKMSKNTSLFVLLAPTTLISAPGLITSYILVDYYVYFLLFVSVNIAFSFTDFLYMKQLLRAPKKCLVESEKDSFDILI